MTALPWFRMYHEFATDPKVQMMSEADQRRFIMLLCLRCCNGDVTLQEREIAFQLRISDAEWSETKARLMERGLIGSDSRPTNWDKRQKSSDSSKSRVWKHRAKKAERQKQDCNVTETAQIKIESKKEIEILSEVVPTSDNVIALVPVEVCPRPPRASRLNPDWQLPDDWRMWARTNFPASTDAQVTDQAEQFRDYWIAKPGAQANKLNWEATWRNWCRRGLSQLAHVRKPQHTGRYHDHDSSAAMNARALARVKAELGVA